MKKIINISDTLFDLTHTILVSIILLILGIIAVHLFAIKLGPESFGQLQLARRIVNYFFPLFIFGLNTSLVRQISFYNDTTYRYALQISGLIITIFGCFLAAYLMCFGKQINGLLFNSNKFNGEEILYLIISTIIFAYQYALLRATDRLLWANLLLLLIMGFIPLLIAYFTNFSDNAFILIKKIAFYSLIPSIFNIIFLLKYEWRKMLYAYLKHGIINPIRNLINYGIKRMPVPICLGIMYSGGAIALNNSRAHEASGYFLAALFIIRILEQAVGPVAVVMLPKLSKIVGKKNHYGVRYYTLNVFEYTLTVGLFFTIQIIILSNYLINLIYGSEYEQSIAAFRILAIAIVPVLFFSLTQTIIDAITEKGMVLLAVVLGMSISLLGFSIIKMQTAETAAWLFVISISLSSTIMYCYLIWVLEINPIPQDIIEILIANIISGFFCFLISNLLKMMELPFFVVLVGSFLLSIIVYFYVSLKFKLNLPTKCISFIAEYRSNAS